MIRLVMIALVTLSSGAHAKPGSLPVAICKPGKGTPLFEARWNSGAKAKVTTRLFTSGQWTRSETGYDGKTAAAKTGCIDDVTLDRIKASLKVAKWIKMKAQTTCAAVSRDSIEYYAFGKRRFTETLCSPITLDSDSHKAIDSIGALIPDGLMIQSSLEQQLQNGSL